MTTALIRRAAAAVAGVALAATALAVPAAASTDDAFADDTPTLAAVPEGGFIDVPEDHPFAEPIYWLAEIAVNGYDDGTYRPTAPISRQAFAAIMWRGYHVDQPDPTCTEAPFADIPADHPFCGEIAWLAAEGLASGYDDGTFRPTAPVSRQAATAMLYRDLTGEAIPACEAPAFPDVPVSNQFCGAIAAFAAEGVVSAYPDGSFHPTAAVSRQAIAVWLYRLYGAVE